MKGACEAVRLAASRSSAGLSGPEGAGSGRRFRSRRGIAARKGRNCRWPAGAKTREQNLDSCTCSYEGCPRRGKCCECLQYHLSHKQLPGCCFPPEVEKPTIGPLRDLCEFIPDRLLTPENPIPIVAPMPYWRAILSFSEWR